MATKDIRCSLCGKLMDPTWYMVRGGKPICWKCEEKARERDERLNK